MKPSILVEESSLQAIADAIRSKTGGTDTYRPREMAPAIRNLPGTGVLQNLSVTENGYYAPGAGVDGFDSVSVAVPNSALTSADEGKVVVSGALMPQTSLNVSTNGTYDTTTKNSVVVNVSSGGGGSSTILYGDTAPSSSQGQNGDIYLKIIGSNLPSGAVQVEYIASTGTQWINTGYLGKANSRYMADVYIESSQSAGSPAVFGGRTGHMNRAATFFVFNFFAGQWNNQEVRSGTISSAYKEIRMTIEMDQDGYTVTNILSNDVGISGTDVGDIGGLAGLLELRGEDGNGDSDQNGRSILLYSDFRTLVLHKKFQK